ncbi:hypothetical protein [Mucilaginibacter defluvii]|uniref:Uncharacterized protein n=1 Tax=Mucilaginibacter defluvii TaxID=1196019 RepID=A0ABP9FST8_9SPHI
MQKLIYVRHSYRLCFPKNEPVYFFLLLSYFTTVPFKLEYVVKDGGDVFICQFLNRERALVDAVEYINNNLPAVNAA